jgi:hypothetical protein
MLEIETRFFESELPNLLKTDIGKYVLIKDKKIHGVYEALGDALKAGYERFAKEEFLVKQIVPAQQPMNFANNYLFA